MDNKNLYSVEGLRRCSYRILQKMARSMNLPCTLKKIYLIELIHARRYLLENDVQPIINRALLERLQAKIMKRKGHSMLSVQGTEISSTNSSHSPPITMTPKRSGNECGPSSQHPITKYIPQSSKKVIGSDRVLRKRINPRSYSGSLCLFDSAVLLVKKEERSRKYPNVNVILDCTVNKVNPSILRSENSSKCDASCSTKKDEGCTQVKSVSRSQIPMPARKTSLLKYPHSMVKTIETRRFEVSQRVGFRQKDGTFTRINALIRKSRNKNDKTTTTSIQDILNSSIDFNFSNINSDIYSSYPNMYSAIAPNHCNINSVIAPSYSNINSGVALSYSNINSVIAPSYSNINSDVALNYSNINSVIAPSYSNINSDIAPSYSNINSVIAPSYSNINSDIAPSYSNINSVIAPSYSNINSDIAPSYSNINSVIAPSYSNINCDIAPSYSNINYTIAPGYSDINSAIDLNYPNTNSTKYGYSNSNNEIEQNFYINTPMSMYGGNAESQCYQNNAKVENMEYQCYQNNAEVENVESQCYQNNIKVDNVESQCYHNNTKVENMESQCYQNNILVENEGYQTEVLPRINSVFSNFNNVKNLTQPIYVQVGDEPKTAMTTPIYTAVSTVNSGVLETLYNYNMSTSNQSLLKIATVTDTKTIYSTPVCVTSMTQVSAAIPAHEQYHVASYQEDNNQYNLANNNNNIVPLMNIGNNFGQNEGTASLNCADVESQNVDSSSISNMIEEVLQLINQDEDYTNLTDIGIEVQCILCHWAGPKNVLENHVWEEHMDQIHKQVKNEFNITFSLGNLVQQQLWLSQVIEHDCVLYVLSAKYQDPDHFMAKLSTLSSNTMNKQYYTICMYDKVTGEPHTWESVLQPLSHKMPYENEPDYWNLKLSQLNLLPNSVNLKLVNLKLVGSPSKVVVGNPELNDIHITLFVNI